MFEFIFPAVNSPGGRKAVHLGALVTLEDPLRARCMPAQLVRETGACSRVPYLAWKPERTAGVSLSSLRSRRKSEAGMGGSGSGSRGLRA